MFENFQSNAVVKSAEDAYKRLHDDFMSTSVGKWVGEHKAAAIGIGIVGTAALALGGYRSLSALEEVGSAGSRISTKELLEAYSPTFKLEELPEAPGYIPEIRTADRQRFLIGLPNYGANTKTAEQAERLIAKLRDGILSGKIADARQLELATRSEYLPKFWPEVFSRYGSEAGGLRYNVAKGKWMDVEIPLSTMQKQSAHLDRIRDLVSSRKPQISTTVINGETVNLMKVKKGILDHMYFRQWDTFFDPPNDARTMALVESRRDTIFHEIRDTIALPHSPELLQQNLDRAAEFEWLSAKSWRSFKGTAGMAQIQNRAMLEAAGIDTGRYGVGIDPNMEALATPSLETFKSNYPKFFQQPPGYIVPGAPSPAVLTSEVTGQDTVAKLLPDNVTPLPERKLVGIFRGFAVYA